MSDPQRITRAMRAHSGRFPSRALTEENRGEARKRAHNRLENGISALQDVVVPEAKHSIATRLQVLRAQLVVCCLFLMLPSVRFDDDPYLEANKIDDVWS